MSGARHSPSPTFNWLFQAEPARNMRPWKSIDDLEIAVAEHIVRSSHGRLHGGIGLVPLAEFKDDYHRHNTMPTAVDASVQSPC